jgi:hypothetical protein
MEIHLHTTTISELQRRQVETWAATNQADDIQSIAVHDALVSVHGSPDHITSTAGTAIRKDDLSGELSAALANMRNIASSPSPFSRGA